MKHLVIIGLWILVLAGCASDNKVSPVALDPSLSLPYAHGRPNELLVIADSSLWNGPAGDTFFYYFSAPYILLPQPEAIFDIRHMTPQELAKFSAKKEFKTIAFLADMDDDNSVVTRQVTHDIGEGKVLEARQGKGYTTILAQNKWARNQQLFYILGFGPEKLSENISRNFPLVADRINEKDIEMVSANAYQSGVNNNLMTDIEANYGIHLKIPGSFKKILYESATNTTWYRSNDREIIANILIHKRPYQSESQLTKEGIKAIRDEVGKIITTQQPNTYMRINDVDLPLFVETKTINGLYTVQAKGIWDIVNDFKGGPFISNLMLDQDRNELIFVDGFIFAPNKDRKRNYMQEMELIIDSAVPADEH